MIFRFFLLAVFILSLCSLSAAEQLEESALILNVHDYHDAKLATVADQLQHRLTIQPFNVVALIIFLLAIIHTLFANNIANFAKVKKEERKKKLAGLQQKNLKASLEIFEIELLHFAGEVEIIFGLWVIPLMIALSYTYSWAEGIHYLSTRNYVEPIFVVIMMALAATAPIVKFAENCLRVVAKWGGGTVSAWWLSILIFGSILGSFITEPAAMTVSVFLLIKQFYRFLPSPKVAYATLGLLFTNISVGGVLTNFSAPPVLLVARVWQWDTAYMFWVFGIKAVLGIIIATFCYYYFFKSEFHLLEAKKKEMEGENPPKEEAIPLWIMAVNLSFLVWIVIHNHYPAVFVGSFMLFLGFHKATQAYQKELDIKPAILVGFFLAGLVIHGGLQGWWIEPILAHLPEHQLMLIAMVLTAFNDNAAITYLASLIPNLSEALKYAVMVGAITGGGLTVIANAPNPAGQTLLGKYFTTGISPVKLLLAALFPTLIMLGCFYFL